MSHKIIYIAIFTIFWGRNSLALGTTNQNWLNWQNPSGAVSNETMSTFQVLGGKHITSVGILRCLVVFIEFKNESSDNPYWPPRQPPKFMNGFIDPDTFTKSTGYTNLTNFFDQMSFGKLKLIGQVYHNVLPYTEFCAKIWGYTRGRIIRDALFQLDSLVNFQDYDNWGSNGDYDHYNSGDGIVDMIFAIFRSAEQLGWTYGGEASLGFGECYEIDGVKINPKRLSTDASGVTCLFKLRSPECLAIIARHEFGHMLLGEDHPYNSRADDQHKIWSLLNDGRIVNAYEREKLGWITVPELKYDQLNVIMADYISTGDAYKYHPQNGQPNEYYYFENHQKINPFDDESLNPKDKGVYVLHMKDRYNESNNIRCKTANGCFIWDNPFRVAYPPKPDILLPAFRIVRADPGGENHRDALLTDSGKREFIRVMTTTDSLYELGEYFRGFQCEETFSADHYNVFSPWSNPNTHTWSGEQTDFAMEVLNDNEGDLTVSFYLNNPLQTCPSIPLNYKIIDTMDGSIIHPKQIWSANSEPDIAGYEIERKLDNGVWQVFAVVDKNQTTFIDSSIIVGNNGDNSCAFYRISAFDNQDLYSNYTEICSVYYKGGDEITSNYNVTEDNSDRMPDQPGMNQNYPNPFNNSTLIQVVLPRKQTITLSIYDITGKLVKNIFSGELNGGIHKMKWDGKNDHGNDVASGLYLYQMLAGGHILTKKMVLVR